MRAIIVLCVVSAVMGAALALVLYDPWEPDSQSVAQEPGVPAVDSGPLLVRAPAAEHAELTPEERINVSVYQSTNHSAVNINTKSVQPGGFFLEDIIAPGEGSGTVIDQQGHVLTNFHVVEDAQEIQVTLHNGRTYRARPVGVDPPTDVAVLKIDAPADELHPVTFGDSSRLLVGQRVFAIGNPFGLERTLSTGVISSLNRSIPGRHRRRMLKSIIQIDAAINPGNSGGPLLDSSGRMIGMNTAIASKTGESAGVGFAIPIGTIARVVPQLITNGRVIRPNVGITRLLPLESEKGVIIVALEPGGPAEQAGLKAPQIVRRRERRGVFLYEYRTVQADVITAVDGQPVASEDEFLTAVESKRPGDQLTITIVRKGEKHRVPVRVRAGE